MKHSASGERKSSIAIAHTNISERFVGSIETTRLE